MGRPKKGKLRSDLWAQAGGIESIIQKLQKADILNRNTEYSSEIWSQLAIDLLTEDTHRNRHWLWVVWRHNRRRLRERVGHTHLTTGTEEIPHTHQDTEVADMETQCDTEILERETDFDSQPEHQEPDTDSEAPERTPEPTRVPEGEPGGNVQRQCPEVKQMFFISMTRKMWDGIKPLEGSSKLRPPWTERVYDRFKETNPCCTLSFKYQHVKTPWSRKKNLPYLQMKAVCTFPSCPAKYSFTVQNNPAALGQDVNMLVQQTGDIQHKLSEKKARPATYLKRGRIAKCFHSTHQSTPNQRPLAGNMTECLSKKVLKAIGSEMRKKESIHSDVMMEISLMQTLLTIPGYVQLFSMSPFIVHLFTERGVSILVHHLQSKSPVSLYLDATGGVVSKIPGQPKRVLYYALALPGNARGPLPICEMLSNDHSVPPITFWLMQFTSHLSKYTQINVHQVETHYSRALIQSVLLAFNKEHIGSYLDRAYEFCIGKKSWDEMKSYTVLHICSAHILKAVRQAISRQTEDKGLRDFATCAFARLQEASNMTESRVVFRAFCALLTTPQNTHLVKESLCVLESVISRSKEDTLEETSQSEDWEMCESEERRHAVTITGRSAFSAFFQQIMKEVKEEEAGDEETCVANPYFCPGILTVLFDAYLGIFPLWSGLLLGDLTTGRDESCEQDLVTTLTLPTTRDTSCHIERFGIVKHSIMHNKNKVKPGTFIRKLHQSLQARYTDQHNLPQELLLQPEPPLNLEQCQETWRKKKEDRFPDTKSKFVSVPQNTPVPQRKKRLIHEDVAESQKRSSPEPVHVPAEALPVEEEIDMLWAKPASALVVAVVKSADPSLEFPLRHEEFLTLRPQGWISGETIECYIRAVLNAKGANLYQLSHYTTGVVLTGTEDQVIRQGLKKVNFEQYDGVISVVNIAGMCWRFVYLHAITNTIFIVDPQRGHNEVQLATQACTKFGEYFRMRGNQYGRKDWVDTVWKPGTIQHSFQEDGFSCGVFVMLMAKQVVGHFPKIPESISITPSEEEMCHTRRHVAKVILQASVSREEYCSVCGQTDTKTNGIKDHTEELCTWVQCELCQRWFHVQCLKISLPPEEEPWTCALCL